MKTKIILVKLTRALLLIFLIGISLFFALQKKPKKFDGTRVVLVDTIGNNHIFRGSNPFKVKKGKLNFAYEDLKSYLNQNLEKNGHKKIEDFYLIDLSLLDPEEYHQIKSEHKFFRENPDKGILISKSITTFPLLFTGLDIEFLTDGYNDNITQRINQLHDILAKQNGKPVLIYVHCNGGRDRSGVITAAYRLLFKNMNLQQVNQQNIVDVGRNSDTFYRTAIESYCRYIKRKFNKPDSFCSI